MTVTCPNCGKEFPRNDNKFTGHLSVCLRNLDENVKKQMLAKAMNETPPAAPTTDSQVAPATNESVQPQAAQTASFAYGDDPEIDLQKLDLDAKPSPGPQAQTTAQPVSTISEDWKALFQTFGDKWNAYLSAPPDEPDPSRYRWKDTDTDLAVRAFTGLDRKYGTGTLANWAPELLGVMLVVDIIGLVVGGLRAKGKLKLPQRSGVKDSQGFTVADDKQAAAAWEEELKGRNEGKGPIS